MAHDAGSARGDGIVRPTHAAGQERQRATTGAAGATKGVARTPWGDPDLQGIWTNASSTPLERAAGALSAGRGRDTPAGQHDPNKASVARTTTSGLNAAHASAASANPAARSIVADCRPVGWETTAFNARRTEYEAELEVLRRPERPGTWEESNPFDRCITRGLPGCDDPGVLQPQLPDHPIARLRRDSRRDDPRRPHHPARRTSASRRASAQWMGNSRGRWEGQTLVVESTGFTDKIREFSERQRLPNGDPLGRYEASFGTSTLTLVERFTRLDENTIDYRFTVADPATFTKPWTVAAPMAKIAGPIHEYACHEGNYAMANMLRIARAEDEAAKAADAKKK